MSDTFDALCWNPQLPIFSGIKWHTWICTPPFHGHGLCWVYTLRGSGYVDGEKFDYMKQFPRKEPDRDTLMEYAEKCRMAFKRQECVKFLEKTNER